MNPTIGVFDSGFGGLTVLRALMDRFPHARFAFLGDTARLPYGSKSRRTIARYAAQSAQFLVREQGAEFLVIACNTASALALDAIQEAVSMPAPGVPVLGVIEPGASAARAASRTGDVLVIATDATVHSHAYAAACRARGLRALEKACPLLVPLVEEGWTDHPVTGEVIRIYLAELMAEAAALGLAPDVLVLGCTHYPLLRPLIEAAVPPGMKVIDSAEAAAESAVQLFNHQELAQPLLSATSRENVAEGFANAIDGLGNPILATPFVDTAPESFANATDAVGQPILATPRVERIGEDAAPTAEVRCFATDSVEKFERLGSRFLARPTGRVELVDLGG
ncbi:MAG: glutamate racemase [Terracidiphilus sp.]